MVAGRENCLLEPAEGETELVGLENTHYSPTMSAVKILFSIDFKELQ